MWEAIVGVLAILCGVLSLVVVYMYMWRQAQKILGIGEEFNEFVEDVEHAWAEQRAMHPPF